MAVEHELGSIVAVEAKNRLLLDDLVLVSADGLRSRFDLLAGQLDLARGEAARYAPQSPRARQA